MHPLHNVPTCWLPVPLVLLAQQQLQQRVAWSWNWQCNLDSSNMEKASFSWESQSFHPNCLFWTIKSSIKYGWWIIVDQWDQSFKIIGSTKLQNESITKLQHGSTTKLQETFYTVTNPPAILPWWCLLPKAHLGRFLTCQKETNSSSRFHRFFLIYVACIHVSSIQISAIHCIDICKYHCTYPLWDSLSLSQKNIWTYTYYIYSTPYILSYSTQDIYSTGKNLRLSRPRLMDIPRFVGRIGFPSRREIRWETVPKR